ncbi:MAG: hypothetical protein ACOX0Z_01500 [Candidatus Nanosyncoccaceae bacterium]
MLKPEFETVLRDKISQLDDVVLDQTTLEGHDIFRLNPERYQVDNVNQLNFAIIKRKSRPLLVDLACDFNLSQNLQTKYESVVPSKIMDEATWIRIIGSGIPTESEIIELLHLAYHLTEQAFNLESTL